MSARNLVVAVINADAYKTELNARCEAVAIVQVRSIPGGGLHTEVSSHVGGALGMDDAGAKDPKLLCLITAFASMATALRAHAPAEDLDEACQHVLRVLAPDHLRPHVAEGS